MSIGCAHSRFSNQYLAIAINVRVIDCHFTTLQGTRYQRDQYTLNPLNYVCYIVVYGIDPTTVGFLVQCSTKPKIADSIPTAALQFFSLARVDTLHEKTKYLSSRPPQLQDMPYCITMHCNDEIELLLCIVPVQSVILEKTLNGAKTNQCLTVAEGGNGEISGKGCASSLNMRWVWSVWRKKGGYLQLMNVMTLQCLEFLNELSVCTTRKPNQTGKVAMKQCNETDGQLIRRHIPYIQTQLCDKGYYLRLKEEQNIERYPAFSHRSKPDRWTDEENDQKRLTQKPISYRGKCSMYSIKTIQP